MQISRRRFIVLILLFLIAAHNTNGQSVANYAFSNLSNGSLILSKDGNAVDMSTGITQVYPANTTSYSASTINIGFTFYFMSVPYNRIK
jgi:hypothetical protein